MKFSRGDQVIHDTTAIVGIVMGSVLDWDNHWYCVWRSARDVMFYSPESSLDWFPHPSVTYHDPRTGWRVG